jgi:amino acid adenylation domain-containing protein
MTDVKSVAVDFDPFQAGEIARTAPITGPQREIWSAIYLGGDGANRAYNEGLAIRLTGALDVAALQVALAELVTRHEALRTTFSSDGSKLLIAPRGASELSQLDLRSESDPLAAYRAFERSEVDKPFDLERGPLLRATLVRLGDSEAVLLLLVHHIVCDGWSFGVLVRELGALYSAHEQGATAQLEPPESFVDYAEERARHSQSSDARKSLAYWIEQFADGVPTLELPLDKQRPALRSYRAERVEHEIGPELVAAIKAFAKQQNASLLQLLLTSFQTLLARLSNQWDLVVGISAAGQASSGRYGLVGHAVSFLPIRARLDADGTFSDALARTKRHLGDALEHQDVTFGTLLENLVLARDPSRIPLAPINFNVDQAIAGSGFAGLALEATNVARTHEAFEMFINLVDRKHSFFIEAQYNADLFCGETVRAWLASYEALLAAVVENRREPLAKLPLLTPAAKRALLESGNDTVTPFECDTTLHGFFERQVDADAQREALAFEGQRISYGELDARANRLAHHLRKAGAGPERIVAVCVRRSIDMVVAQLGILKAGAAYLPLDPSYPPERLAYMLQDSGASLIVSRHDSLEALGELGADQKTVLLDAQREQLDGESSQRPEPLARGENIAYVIYTSGSTGKPKGVLVEHRNFANFLAGMDQRLTLSPPGVWLCATSIGFDISLLEIFGSLARGFSVVLHSDESGPEYAIAALIKQHAVTHFQCTPSQATVLLGDALGRAALWGLKELLLGGEALPKDLAHRLTSLSSVRLLNMYGPTETTIWSTSHEVRPEGGAIPIGKPIANTRVYVLDVYGEPVPRGAIGELYIAGAGVTRGYHQRPELTRERFVPDPFVAEASGRMYKTGDLARLRADGNIEFLGRNDHQVKIRGYRIELGEIEVALRTHKAVREVVVIAREDNAGDKRLVAYLVCAETPTVQELKRHLSESGLPEYMLPQAFVTLPKLPTTPNGKLDRRALPPPEQESSLSAGTYVAARTESERRLAAIWQEVLGIGRVSVTNSFFDLGGHSLLAVRLVGAMRDTFQLNVPIARVFQTPTVEQLAAFVDAASVSASDRDDGDASRVEIEL